MGQKCHRCTDAKSCLVHRETIYMARCNRNNTMLHCVTFHNIWNAPFESDILGRGGGVLTHDENGTWDKKGSLM